MVTYQGHRTIAKHDGSDADSWLHYTCAHCGNSVGGAVVATHKDPHGYTVRWLQCPTCAEPSAMDSRGTIHPGARYGPAIAGLPADVERAYAEVRACMSVEAFGSAELMCRSILMHVAVDKGAEEGNSFSDYIDYLMTQGYVTPPMKGWVDLIRQHGNRASHDIAPVDRKRAEGTVQFTAQLLRSVYEMAHIAAQFSASDAPVGDESRVVGS